MAKYEGSVPYTGFIAPADDTDTFHVTDERFNKGGYRSVINQIERLAITPERRKEGMLVKQLDTGGYWTLEGGITNNDWVEPEFATSAIADRLYQPDGTNAFVYTDNNGNLHIDGGIIQNGASYETHAEKLYTTRDFIITRENAVSALAVGVLSGIQVTKYDGLNDLIFGTDKNGFFKIGEPSNLQTVGTRQDNPIAKGLGYYNETLYRWDTTAHMKFNTTSNNLEVSGIKLGTLSGLLNATAGVIGTTTLKTINSQSVIGTGNIVINSEDLRWNGGSTGLDSAAGRASLGLTGNVTTHTHSYLPLSGGTLSGNVTSPTFIGSLTGNASSATKLQTARKINGTSFNGSTDITTDRWGTSRTLTIGSTGKSVNGSADVSWSLAEIGAAVGDNVGYTHDAGSGARWIRIAEFSSYNSYGIISILNSYSNNPPNSVTFHYNSGYRSASSPSITQIGGMAGIFTKARVVYPTSTNVPGFIEVYYNTTSVMNSLYLRLTNSFNCKLLRTATVGSVPSTHTSYERSFTNGGISAYAIQSTELKVGTLSGTIRMVGGRMEAASITISTSEPPTSGRLNGDIWVKS